MCHRLSPSASSPNLSLSLDSSAPLKSCHPGIISLSYFTPISSVPDLVASAPSHPVTRHHPAAPLLGHYFSLPSPLQCCLRLNPSIGGRGDGRLGGSQLSALVFGAEFLLPWPEASSALGKSSVKITSGFHTSCAEHVQAQSSDLQLGQIWLDFHMASKYRLIPPGISLC